MSDIRYYKGVHKVKVLTESVGYWTIEALEDFDDFVDGLRVKVKSGETRIVPSDTVCTCKSLPPTVKEHAYELGMERKLKRMVADEGKKQAAVE